jgi:Fe2+ or Zn2+ uptake regulation protein
MDLNQKIDSLKEKGVPLTVQRYAVLEYLYKNHTHPTAEEIYHSLKKNFSIISQATIYNTLEFLKNYGLIQEITIEKGRSHFDYEVEPHHHFLCRRCDHIYDIDVKGCPLAGKKTVDGHKIEELRPYIIGICSECLKKIEGKGDVARRYDKGIHRKVQRKEPKRK